MRNSFKLYAAMLMVSVMASLPFLTVAQTPTFNKNIAPLIYKNCTPCHRSTEVAPFPLVTYKDVASRAKMILSVIESGYMPPWKFDTLYRHYVNERIMDKKEVALIRQWVHDKMPEGNKKDLPQLPAYSSVSGLGKPDMVLHFKKPFLIKGENKQTFAWIKIPYEIDTDQPYVNVSTIELVPDNKKLVHHIQTSLFEFDEKYFEELKKGEDYYVFDDTLTNQDFVKMMPAMAYQNPRLIHTGLYSPGTMPQVFEENIGIRIPRKGIFIAGMHYDNSPVDAYDNSHFNFYFKKTPVSRLLMNIDIGTGGVSEIEPPLIIPPDSIATYHTKAQVLEDLSIIYAMPHMHLLGKRIKAWAVTPSGDTINLFRVNEWAYAWQEYVKFNPMIKLPKGTWIYGEATFDNTASNPNNPYHPPRQIFSENKFIMETNDEMFNIYMIALPYNEGDEHKKLR